MFASSKILWSCVIRVTEIAVLMNMQGLSSKCNEIFRNGEYFQLLLSQVYVCIFLYVYGIPSQKKGRREDLLFLIKKRKKDKDKLLL